MGRVLLVRLLCTFSLISSATALSNLHPKIKPAPLPHHGGGAGTRAAVLTKNFQLLQHACSVSPPVNVWGGRSGVGVGKMKPTAPSTHLHQSSIVYERRRHSISVPAALSRCYQAYVMSCEESPVVTKSVTAGVIMGLGDFIAQRIEASTAPLGLHCFQMVRTGAFIMTGLFFKAPFLHVWYNILEKLSTWLSVRHGKSKNTQLLAQLLADQTIGVAVYYALNFYAYDIFESLISCRVPMLACTTQKVATKYFSVLMSNYYVWPFVTYSSLRFVPIDLRVLFSSFVGIFWNIYLCGTVAR